MSEAFELLTCLAPRDSADELPSAPIRTVCLTRAGVYISTGTQWLEYRSEDERVEELTQCYAFRVAAEYPSRWRCTLACGCLVQTQKTSHVIPDRVKHWCLKRASA